MYILMKMFVILAVLSSSVTFSSECTKEAAFEHALNTIKVKYPKLYETKKPYEIYSEGNQWVVLGYTPEGMLGGGAPEIMVSKETCEVGRVSLAR